MWRIATSTLRRKIPSAMHARTTKSGETKPIAIGKGICCARALNGTVASAQPRIIDFASWFKLVPTYNTSPPVTIRQSMCLTVHSRYHAPLQAPESIVIQVVLKRCPGIVPNKTGAADSEFSVPILPFALRRYCLYRVPMLYDFSTAQPI